ncbi:MAG: hypothetical protein M3Z08_06580 [Chloroflexota bacterium]|nr:hypothetical protein [Chloroflexota bacterium]
MLEMTQLLQETASYVLKRGHSAEAVQFLQRAFSIQEALSGSDSPESVKIFQNLAALACRQEKAQQTG